MQVPNEEISFWQRHSMSFYALAGIIAIFVFAFLFSKTQLAEKIFGKKEPVVNVQSAAPTNAPKFTYTPPPLPNPTEVVEIAPPQNVTSGNSGNSVNQTVIINNNSGHINGPLIMNYSSPTNSATVISSEKQIEKVVPKAPVSSGYEGSVWPKTVQYTPAPLPPVQQVVYQPVQVPMYSYAPAYGYSYGYGGYYSVPVASIGIRIGGGYGGGHYGYGGGGGHYNPSPTGHRYSYYRH
jgi:hypothetical protein